MLLAKAAPPQLSRAHLVYHVPIDLCTLFSCVNMSTKEYFKNCGSEYGETFCRLGEVLLAFSSGVLTLVAFGTSHWLEPPAVSVTDAVPHSGLWQTCTDDVCTTIPLSAPSYLIASRLFMCLALGAGLFAWVVSIVGLIQHRAVWLMISGVCYAVQALLMMIGLASFAVAFKTGNPRWSYRVGWLACILSLLCALYFISIAIYRLRRPGGRGSSTRGPASSYAPLAQFESASDSEDEKL